LSNVTASITTAEKEPLFKAEETKGACRCEEGALPDEAISSKRETASPKNGSQRHQFLGSREAAKQSPCNIKLLPEGRNDNNP
jgi:hypothetical protein